MTKKNIIYYILFLCFFILVGFVGTVRIAGIPIRPDMFVALLLVIPLILKPQLIDKPQFFQTFMFVPFVIYFIIHTCITKPYDSYASSKDSLFIMIPLYSMIVFIFLSFILKKIDLLFVRKCINIFLIINLLLSFIQMFNFFGLNDALVPYYKFVAENNSSCENMISLLYQRVFGTIGNPTWFPFVYYLLARLTIKIGSSKVYLLFAAIALLLSCGRMILIYFLIFELFIMPFEKGVKLKTIKKFVITGVLIAITGIIGYNTLEFVRYALNEYITGTALESYSVTYRADMFDWMLNSGWQTILVGGVPFSKFPPFVDSEWVQRILQYGIIGTFLLYLPYLYFVIKNYKNIYSYLLVGLCMWVSITTHTVSNFALIPFILIYMAIIYRLDSKDFMVQLQNNRKEGEDA